MTARRLSSGPNKLCVMCGQINNRLPDICDSCSGGEKTRLTTADLAYLEWKRQRDKDAMLRRHAAAKEKKPEEGE